MSGPGGDQHKDGRTVPNTTDVQDLTMNDDVAENAAITTENLDSAIQGNTPAPTQSASSSSAPVSVPVPQNTTVTTPAQQNALPHLPGPFTPEQMEQIRAFLAATAYLSDSTSLTSSSTSSMGSAPSVPVPTETGVAKPSTAPTPVRTPLTNQNSAERRNADNSQMDTDNSPTPRRTRDQNDVDEEELSDIPPAPVFQTENERKWVLVRNNQVLPTVPYTGRAPEPTNTPAYTAWILNNLCHSFPNEPLLWTLLGRNGGVENLERLLRVKVRTTGANTTEVSELNLGRPQARTAIAAHAKLPCTNLGGQVCLACSNNASKGPFRTCITTTSFGGSCTNCQYYSKAAMCSFRGMAMTASTPAVVNMNPTSLGLTNTTTRGTKRARTTVTSNERPLSSRATLVTDLIPFVLRRLNVDELDTITEAVNAEHEARAGTV